MNHRLASRMLLTALRPAGYAALLTLSVVSTTEATIIGFVDNPTGNSVDWTNAVIALGGTINADINFDAHPARASNTLPALFQPDFYSATDGVTMALSGASYGVRSSVGPSESNTSTGPTSPGEGMHGNSNHLSLGFNVCTLPQNCPTAFALTFDVPVAGLGLYLIDMWNPASSALRRGVTLNAYDGPNGAGNLLGSFDAAQFNFQRNRQYFMGVLDTSQSITSVVISRANGGGDIIGLDDVLFARAPNALPEPGSAALLSLGLALLLRKRRKAPEHC